MKRVLLEARLHKMGLELLEREVHIVAPPGGRHLDPATDLRGVHGLIVSSLPHLTGDVMDQADVLEVIGRPGIGVDNIDLQAATARGIAVVHTPDGPTESTAEHAVALILALARRIRAADINARRLPWRDRPTLLGTELAGKTLGLVGLGRIGSRVAEICGSGLHMRVMAYDPYVPASRATSLGAILCDDLEELLGTADFISLHVPLTPETRGLIGRDELAAMKDGSYLVNCARGPVVDEGALVEALRVGKLAGAGLDVFDPEPPDASNPLLALDNVIVTPHVGSYTEDGVRKMSVGVAEEVLKALRGQRPDHLANPEVWETLRR